MIRVFNVPKPALPLPRFVGDYSRRIQMNHLTPHEQAIHMARDLVESLGAHPFLTEAVVALGVALGKVADYLETEPPA